MDQNDTFEQPGPLTPGGPTAARPATYAPPAYGPPGYAPSGEPEFAVPGAGVTPQKTRWRDVVFGWRSAVAVFVAGIVLGGLGGAALTVIVEHGRGSSPTIGRFPGGQFGRFNPYGGPYGGQGSGQGSGQGGPGSGQGGAQGGQSGSAGGLLGGETG